MLLLFHNYIVVVKRGSGEATNHGLSNKKFSNLFYFSNLIFTHSTCQMIKSIIQT